MKVLRASVSELKGKTKMKPAKFFDWWKGALCLMSVALLCSALGSTTLVEVDTTFHTSTRNWNSTVVYKVDTIDVTIDYPPSVVKPIPFAHLNEGSFLGYFGKFHTRDGGEDEVELKVFDENGYAVKRLPNVVLPPAPTTLYAKWSPPEEDSHKNAESIIFFCCRFFASANAHLLQEYDNRIAANDKDYEAYVCRAFAWVATLWKEQEVGKFATGCGIDFNPENGRMKLRDTPGATILEEMRQNDRMDEICRIAVPVFKAAINDLDKFPKDWPGDIIVSKETGYDVDETVYFDYADAQLIKAIFCEVISFMNLVRGYRDPVTGKPDGTNPEAFEEARAWWAAAAMQLNAFNIAQYNRTDYAKIHFFELNGSAFVLIDSNMQNLIDLPYWTTRVELGDLAAFAFERREKKDFLRGRYIDFSLRSLFEGKVSSRAGTFPVFAGNFPNISEEYLPDPTCGGMFPGMSRTMLGEYAELFGSVYPYASFRAASGTSRTSVRSVRRFRRRLTPVRRRLRRRSVSA